LPSLSSVSLETGIATTGKTLLVINEAECLEYPSFEFSAGAVKHVSPPFSTLCMPCKRADESGVIPDEAEVAVAVATGTSDGKRGRTVDHDDAVISRRV
jgi:hypothetical protein